MPWVRKFAPPVAGVLLVALFVVLAFWQLDRASGKKMAFDSFDGAATYTKTDDFNSLDVFQRIEVDGRFESDRQLLIDNIPLNSRPGYYVITPFLTGRNNDYLLVNRGWISRGDFDAGVPLLDVEENYRTIRGMAADLPRAGFRMGAAFEGSPHWPKVAVFPNLDDIAMELDEAVLPVVLLLSPDADDGFTRNWRPDTRGPMVHYAYAFQWFAMAATLLVIIFWQMRKQRVVEDAEN